MKHKKALIVLTAVGVMGATAAVAGAAGLSEKVSGLLRSDVQVTVNGDQTGLQPVYINGKAYLPVRDTAGALGYEVVATGKQIQLQSKAETRQADPSVEEQRIRMTGVVVSKTVEGDTTRLEVRGKGGSDWMILGVTADTVIENEAGEAKTVDDIKEGTHVAADYGPIVAMSYPGQSAAAKIVIGAERLIKEDAVSSVAQTEAGWKVTLGAAADPASQIVLNVGEDTLIVKANGEPVKPEELQTGAKVRAYYGPLIMKSLPAQSPAELIVVLPDEQAEQ
ncbi:hypothetical protein [Cohnella algarum]|uniref:hypothetical protein n=1 Tax=Cohnella algarum TaxID=2044859 RepID=UPI0019679FC3|nr:hypothetical protein [Cohnella algarum]MBN2980758.1 hypothetical protein [Cohnella algarum]